MMSCYCKFCAWIKLTPRERRYCVAKKKPPAGVYPDPLQCARPPGHDGVHVACSPSRDCHEMLVWPQAPDMILERAQESA